MKITCVGTNMSPSDIVWIIYSLDKPSSQKVIYSDSIYLGDSSKKYLVESLQAIDAKTGLTTLTSHLNIMNIDEQDMANGYECVCNIYKRCINTNHAKANATLSLLQLTTSKNEFDLMSCGFYFTLLIYYEAVNQQMGLLCQESAYKTAEFTLIFLTVFSLIFASIFIHFSQESWSNLFDFDLKSSIQFTLILFKELCSKHF